MLPDAGLTARWYSTGALALACSGLFSVRRERGNVLLAYEGEGCVPKSNSSSAFSGMFGSRLRLLHDGEAGYESSITRRGLLRRPWWPNGDAGRRWLPRGVGMNRPEESTPGEECALCRGCEPMLDEEVDRRCFPPGDFGGM